MDLPELNVRHGALGEIDGPPRLWRGIFFIAAGVELFGNGLELTHSLVGHVVSHPISKDIHELIFRQLPVNIDYVDAAWVRGRMEASLQVPTTARNDRSEESCLFASLVAVVNPSDHPLAIPFCCVDHYGESYLMFSEEDAPPVDLKNKIASAFWDFLLSAPTELKDYEDNIDHIGIHCNVRFGVHKGIPFVEPEPD